MGGILVSANNLMTSDNFDNFLELREISVKRAC
jgi:hypothetical protein